MLNQLIRFELFYQLKQRALPFLVVLFVLFGYMSGANGFSSDNVNVNANYQVFYNMGLFTLGSVFIIMFFAVAGVLRDSQFKMDEIVYSSPVAKSKFFWTRFAGIYVLSVVAFSPFIFGIIAGHTLPPHDPDRLGPFNLIVYIIPWLTMVLPNIFTCTTVLFSISLLARSSVATYVGAVLVYGFYFICSIFLNSPLMASSVPASPEAMAIAAIADPFGLSAFFEQTQFWTPYEKNTSLLSFSGHFLLNRVIWLSICAGILMLTYKLFSFRNYQRKAKKETKPEAIDTILESYVPTMVSEGFRAAAKALYSSFKLEFKSVVKSLPFLAIMGIWLVIIIVEIYTRVFQGGQYADVVYPVTNIILEHLVDPLKWLAIMLIVFYSGELVWRERLLMFNEITDSTQTPNWALFMAKFFAIMVLPFCLMASGMFVAFVFQVVFNAPQIDIGQYFGLLVFNGLQPIIFVGLALFIQSIVPNKYLGMVLTGLVILSSPLSRFVGIEHSLLRFATVPGVTFTNMTGYEGHIQEYFHHVIYWLGLVGILVTMAFKYWKRGTKSMPVNPIKLNWAKPEKLILSAFVFLMLIGGSLVFYNTNIVNDYQTKNDLLDFRENYERNFKQYEHLLPLYAVEMSTTVDLFPEENRYHVEANYLMINREQIPVDSLLITAKLPLTSITLEGAQLAEFYEEFDVYLFVFDQSVMPSDSLKMSYVIDYKTDGYDFDRSIVSNGTYLMHRNIEPNLRYRKSLEISEPRERRERGLPPQEDQHVTESHLDMDKYKFGRVKFETTVSTTKDQIPLCSGQLIENWTENERNYATFKSRQPIIPTVAYFSADYATLKEQYKGISIEQYYHPEHSFNIDSIELSIKRSLDYCQDNFGSYPMDHIRMAEIPGHWGFGGFAHPGMISMVADRLYLTNISDPERFNLVAKRTIHEVAHQWWGHLLAPKVVEGGSILVEGLAKYTEGVIMEKYYGKKAIYQISETANRTYFSGVAWSTEAEPPLYLVNGQSYLSYGKNFQVMMAMKDLIGEEKINQVLKRITDRYRNDQEFSATSIELINELYDVTPIEYQTLIDDWFKRIIIYDVSIQDAVYEELPNGKFEIKLQIGAKRFELNDEGVRVPIDIDEPLQIGLFQKHPGNIGLDGGTIYLKSQQISQDGQEIKLIVDQLPGYVSVDPYGTRVDENLTDNTIRLKH